VPRKDSIHDAVKNALVKDGWTILDDPYRIEYDDADVYADLRVEKSDDGIHIKRTLVIEIKGFLHDSPMTDLGRALGQYQLYRGYLSEVAPDEELYLAVDEVIYRTQFQRVAFQRIITYYDVALLIVDTDKEEIVQWIS
jgi:hypothetical protein